MADSATTRELDADALPAFMSLLQDVLEQHGTVTLRAAKRLPGDEIGAAWFASNRIAVLRGLPTEQFTDTLTHELVHLHRGPVAVSAVDVEETEVEDQAQALLYGSPRPAARPKLRLIVGGAA
jgi:hypothetical protein